MAQDSKIEWTDNTFNIVWGCAKVSPACANCYAEAFSHRLGKDLWGPGKERQVMSESYWRQPLKWDKAAAKDGVRRKVFCSSMADVFEDHPTVNEQRARLWELIPFTPNLDWLLLTKRPENFRRMLPASFRPNIWLGVTAENQEWADKRIPYLLETPATVRFLSCEPLLGAIDLTTGGHGPLFVTDLADGRRTGIHWVIAGGESGHGARPMHPAWARSLRDQCEAAGVAFFMKQGSQANWERYKDFDSFPADLQERRFPDAIR